MSTGLIHTSNLYRTSPGELLAAQADRSLFRIQRFLL